MFRGHLSHVKCNELNENQIGGSKTILRKAFYCRTISRKYIRRKIIHRTDISPQEHFVAKHKKRRIKELNEDNEDHTLKKLS